MPAGISNPTSGFSGRQGFLGLSWPLIVCCIATIAVVLNGTQLFGDGDTHWHIGAARWMLEHGQVLNHDVFSHTMPGVPWNSHEWLSALVLYGAYQTASWPGLVVLTVTAYVAALGLIARYLLDRLEPAYGILLTVFAGASIASHLLARPHVLVLPILVFWAISCMTASDQHRRPSWFLVPLMTLWANMHGSFVVGIGLVVVFGLEAWMRAGQARNRIRVLKVWGIFFLAILFASLVSPHSIQGILFPLKVNHMPFMLEVIGEWQSPNFQQVTMQEMWILGLLGVAVVLRLRIPPLRTLLLLLLIHMSLQHVRHVDLLGALAPLLIASPLAVALKDIHSRQKSAAALDRFFASGVRHANPIVSIAALVVSLFIGLALPSKPLVPPQQVAPVNAVAAAKRLGLSGNVFNGYIFGGYLIYSGIPPFIDGRADMYGDDFLKKFIDAYNASPGKLLPLLHEYKVEWTLLAPDTPAISVLDASDGWNRVYADEHAVIHQRLEQAANQ